MKPSTAPPIYPELPTEDGQNYRLQKISEIEKQLIKERDARKALYKKYKRGINITDGVDTTLISAGVIMAGVGLTVPLMLPLEIIAIVCGCMGVCVKLVRRKLMSKTQKHYEIKTPGESKFEKGYTTRWTRKIFVIEQVLNTNPVTYKINDLKGEEIKGSFYEQELQITEF